MIVFALFVYSEGPAGIVSDGDLLTHKDHVFKHWQAEGAGVPVACVGVDDPAYRRLAAVGLTDKSTQGIASAISAAIGPSRFGEHMRTAQREAQTRGFSGFALRVTELNHPDGFPWLAIGVDAR